MEGGWHFRTPVAAMILTIELTAEEEARLRRRAADRGMEESEYVHALIDEEEKPMTAGAKLLAEWEKAGALGLWQVRPEDNVLCATELRAEVREGGLWRSTLSNPESAVPKSFSHSRKVAYSLGKSKNSRQSPVRIPASGGGSTNGFRFGGEHARRRAQEWPVLSRPARSRGAA
jgi:hypothetical protein